MPGEMLPVNATGVLGLSVLLITAVFAVFAIRNLIPRRKKHS